MLWFFVLVVKDKRIMYGYHKRRNSFVHLHTQFNKAGSEKEANHPDGVIGMVDETALRFSKM